MSMSQSTGSSQSTSTPIQTPENDLINAISQYAQNLGTQMDSWASQEFANSSQVTDQAVGNFFNVSQQMAGLSNKMTDQYNNITAPDYQSLHDEAASYASPSRMAVDMGQAGATQAQAGDQAIHNAEEGLKSYGLNPADGRYASLDKAAAVQNAANVAGAMNTQRNADIKTGHDLRQQALQFGATLPSSIANANNTAIQANSGAVNSKLANANTGANLKSLADKYLSTAMGIKLPPMGNQSSSSQQSSSSSPQPQQQQRNGGGGGGDGSGGGGNGGGGPAWMPQHGGGGNEGTNYAARGGSQPSAGIFKGLGGNDGPEISEPPPRIGETSVPTDVTDGPGDGPMSIHEYDWGNNGGFGNDTPVTDSGGDSEMGIGGIDTGSDQGTQLNAGDTYGGGDWGSGGGGSYDQPSDPYDTGNSASDYYGGDYSYGDGGDYAAGGAIPDGGIMQSKVAPRAMPPKPGTEGPVPASMSPSGGRQVDDVRAQGPGGQQLNLNAHEFMIPQDVALWKGQEFFQNLIAQSRQKRLTAPAQPTRRQ